MTRSLRCSNCASVCRSSITAVTCWLQLSVGVGYKTAPLLPAAAQAAGSSLRAAPHAPYVPLQPPTPAVSVLLNPQPRTLGTLSNPQPCTPLQEPSIYRLYEAIMHNGEAVKALINEEFGDGMFRFFGGGRSEDSAVQEEGEEEASAQPPAACTLVQWCHCTLSSGRCG